MNYKQKVVKMDKIGTKQDKNIGNWMVTLGSKLPSRLIRIRVVKGRVLPGFHCILTSFSSHIAVLLQEPSINGLRNDIQ